MPRQRVQLSTVAHVPKLDRGRQVSIADALGGALHGDYLAKLVLEPFIIPVRRLPARHDGSRTAPN